MAAYTDSYESVDQFLRELHDKLGVNPTLFVENYPRSRLVGKRSGVHFFRDPEFKAGTYAFELADGFFAFFVQGDFGNPKTAPPLRNVTINTDGFLTLFVKHSGDLVIWLPDGKHYVRSGEAVIFKRTRDTAKDIKFAPAGNVLTLSLSFTASGLARFAREHSLSVPAVLRMVQAARDPKHAIIHLRDNRFLDIINLPAIMKLGDVDFLMPLLRHKTAELLIVLTDIDPQTTSTLSKDVNIEDIGRLDQIRSLLESRFADPPSLGTLMNMTGLSRRRLSKGFKLVYGHTVREYTKLARLSYARDLLTNSDSSVAEISDACGYENPNNFTRAFKTQFGLTPREYRRT